MALRKLASWTAVLLGSLGAVSIGADRQSPGKAVLIKKIEIKSLGFDRCSDMRLGDLDGDNQLDVLLVQNQGQSITSLTAVDIAGRKLWQVGKPNSGDCKSKSDMPVQIYDIDGDGANEVLCVMGDKLVFLNGKDGAVEKETPLPSKDARDCIVIANLSGAARPQDIVLKNRYKKVWALDKNLKVMWTYTGNTGHFPWPHDFDGDGRDELMCGYAMLGHDGRKIWEADLPGHCDGVAVGNVDGDSGGTREIALATCGGNTFALLSDKGKVLWRRPCTHSQHIIIGDFRRDLPGKEVCGLDRGNDRSARGEDAMVMYSAGGKQLWREDRTDRGANRWLTILTRVANWDDRPGDLILAYRRGGRICPTLYDGYGKPVATFPVTNPEAINIAQHADICGDGREEIVIRDKKSIWIYKNGAESPKTISKTPNRRPQTKLLYNYTYYIGMP